MNLLLTKSNVSQERLIQHDLQRYTIWRLINIDNLPEPFPVLSLDDIISLTLGIRLFYQEFINSLPFAEVCTS